MAIKIIGVTLTIAGALGLTFGIIGLFGSNLIAINPWAMTILGFIFFLSGVGMVKKLSD